MDAPPIVTELNETLDILGQQPLMKIYTQICFCFSVPDPSMHSEIIHTLKSGLQRVSTSFPWLAGQVIGDDAGERNSGLFKIKPLENIPRLVVKDLRDAPSAPTMEVLREVDFPFRLLDESMICPRNTLPTPEELASGVLPVLLVQANFITGGLILSFVAAHSTMDMTGQGQVIYLISKACSNEPFTSEELSSGNLDRRNLIRLLDESEIKDSDTAHQIAKPTPAPLDPDEPVTPLPTCSWGYFSFSPTSLASLKSLAMETVTSGYISTDDALTAFMWQSTMRARRPRLDPAAECTFARAVDVRRHLVIPQAYTGLIQNMTYHTYTLEKLIDAPLGEAASQFRRAVDPKTSNLAHATRALATLMDRTSDRSGISVTATLDLSKDIMLSSWAKEKCYELDFGLGLGKPESVRRPQFTPVESLMYLMPRAPDGEIAAAVCLRDEDMEGLKRDQEFAKYGRFIP